MNGCRPCKMAFKSSLLDGCRARAMVGRVAQWCWARTMLSSEDGCWASVMVVKVAWWVLSSRDGCQARAMVLRSHNDSRASVKVVELVRWCWAHTMGVELVRWLSSSHNGCWACSITFTLARWWTSSSDVCTACAMAARSEWWVWHKKSFTLVTSTCSCLSVARQFSGLSILCSLMIVCSHN
jgi:hypothetical protein